MEAQEEYWINFESFNGNFTSIKFLQAVANQHKWLANNIVSLVEENKIIE